MALDLTVRVFCNPNDVVLVESPTYVGALGVFAAYQCQVQHITTDGVGLVPEALEASIVRIKKEGKNIKLVYTVPTYQNPLGITLPAKRRQQVLQIAKKYGILLIEDDPYCLLGFDGVVLRAIRAEDANGVVYLGSFSKTIAAGLRVGWALAPHGIREKLVQASEAAVLCPSNFSQLTVSNYLEETNWRNQLRVFQGLYSVRRNALLDALQKHMPSGTSWTKPKGGFFSWVTLPIGLDSQAMLPLALSQLVAYVPGTGFYANGRGERFMRLCYSSSSPERIEEGVRRLSDVINDELGLFSNFGRT